MARASTGRLLPRRGRPVRTEASARRRPAVAWSSGPGGAGSPAAAPTRASVAKRERDGADGGRDEVDDRKTFLWILVANITIGVSQERAGQAGASTTRAARRNARDGSARRGFAQRLGLRGRGGEPRRDQVGDRLVAAGELRQAVELRLDESILTGESQAVAGRPVMRSAPARSSRGLAPIK